MIVRKVPKSLKVFFFKKKNIDFFEKFNILYVYMKKDKISLT